MNGYQGECTSNPLDRDTPDIEWHYPSQPNYITMISSTIAGGVFDDADHTTSQNSLIDLFEPAGKADRSKQTNHNPVL